jgi:DNA-binding NarL/FixJ family response regulator
LYRAAGAFGDVRRLSRTTDAAESPERASLLTPRERELAQLIARGKGNAAAAESLGISRKAVENYLTTIYRKLGIRSRAQLAVYIVSARGADPIR